MEDKHSQPHAIMVPMPLQGHLFPHIHLATKLASHGFTITSVNTQHINHQITKSQPNDTEDQDDIFATARKSGLDISYKTVSDVQSDPSVTCLIADTFHLWSATIANKYNLVNISFWTEPALVLSIYYHLDLLREHGHYGSHDNREDTINYIPGVQAIEPKDLMSHLQEADISTPMH
ncbi:UDP-glycosyltransferase 86A1 isoform X1 [Prunus yedoensis var. nudiflora]|uniref:UDP-glycosyltransferase 86A1 isoform X1 n=1 Tax=Prunus yedoensis var. nudiflora TaxID=2094558 RepID=A0A314YP42_PRUYE|nr:UDP-glycosyltransferase 86A1 isoform X1 [Prunus yedoensis var. nudiflora]